ncbi:glutathione S-transferase 3, mitochondrial-like isoform X1 [Artemia franciscana]|uniref:glutathione S-transferase 3, mitochondrial-like isoform X1 n=1 Tax=Artemia franciscana TaxID=6661 RepID=UPI0032DB8528
MVNLLLITQFRIISRLFTPTYGTHIMANVHFQSDYGYVILVGIGSAFMLVWKSLQVGKMRRKFKINYPIMYSADNELFNCYQRAHQNTLEVYPQFLFMLLVGGIQYPLLSATAGAVWIAGRIAYAKGYYTGDPQKRMQGGFNYIGLITLLGTTSAFAFRLLNWV